MNDRWLNENWTQFMSGTDELLRDVRQKAGELQNERIGGLLKQAEERRSKAEAALRSFGEERHSLLELLGELQSELAVAGRPLPGEIS